mgnify:CR=1 FL=1
MVETRNRLDAGEDHHIVAYPHPTKDCSWKCPMYQYCVSSPLIDENPAYSGYYEELLDDVFRQVNPLARYEEPEKNSDIPLTVRENSGKVDNNPLVG